MRFQRSSLLIVSIGFLILLLGCNQAEPAVSGSSGCGVQGAPGSQQRVGPFATQDTAWQRWREAQGAGCDVSNGVFPCYDETWTRGYCFNVFP